MNTSTHLVSFGGDYIVAVSINDGMAAVRLDATEISVQVHDDNPRRLITNLRAAAADLEAQL